MKITIEITKYRDMVTKAYRAGYSCGYNLLSWNGCLDEECMAVFLEVFEVLSRDVILIKRKEGK